MVDARALHAPISVSTPVAMDRGSMLLLSKAVSGRRRTRDGIEDMSGEGTVRGSGRDEVLF